MDLLWPTMIISHFRGKPGNELQNLAMWWGVGDHPLLEVLVSYCVPQHTHTQALPTYPSFKMYLFTGWVTSSDLSILTHSLATRTPMESTQPAPLRWKKAWEKRQFRQTLNAGLDGRLQEVVLHAPPRPPQLRHWLRNQQAQVQTGQITNMSSLESTNLLFTGPPMQTILVVPEERLPREVHPGRPQACVCLWQAQKPHLKHLSWQLAGFSLSIANKLIGVRVYMTLL